jgi:hypothetical protein
LNPGIVCIRLVFFFHCWRKYFQCKKFLDYVHVVKFFFNASVGTQQNKCSLVCFPTDLVNHIASTVDIHIVTAALMRYPSTNLHTCVENYIPRYETTHPEKLVRNWLLG